MATYRLVSRPVSSIVTAEFSSYNEAAQYIKQKLSQATAAVVRPYRKNPAAAASVWAVSYVAGNVSKRAEYARVDMPHNVRVLREDWIDQRASKRPASGTISKQNACKSEAVAA